MPCSSKHVSSYTQWDCSYLWPWIDLGNTGSMFCILGSDALRLGADFICYIQHLPSWGPKESRSVAIRFSCSLGISLRDVSKRTWKETLSFRMSPTVSDNYGCQIHFRDSETGKVPHLAKSGGFGGAQPPQLESRPRFSAVVGSSIYIYICNTYVYIITSLYIYI